MLILGAIVISDIGLVNLLSDQGNESRRREYDVPRVRKKPFILQ